MRGQHHHPVEDLRNIGDGGHDHAGGDVPLLHLHRTHIENAHNGNVQHDVHDRPQEREHDLHGKLRIHEVAVCLAEALGLTLFLNEGLDHTDTRHILLNDAVEAVKALLQNGEERIGAPDDKDDVDQNQREGTGHDHAEAQVETQKRRRAADEKHQAAHKAADYLHHELLELGDVVCDAGDERAGGEAVGLLKAQAHDPFKAGLADVVSVVLAGNVGKQRRTDAAQTAEDHNQQHPDTGGDDQIKIGNAAAAYPQDTLIDDALHHARLIEIHIDLRHHEAGGKQGEKPVFFQVFQQTLHKHKPKSETGFLFFPDRRRVPDSS